MTSDDKLPRPWSIVTNCKERADARKDNRRQNFFGSLCPSRLIGKPRHGGDLHKQAGDDQQASHTAQGKAKVEPQNNARNGEIETRTMKPDDDKRDQEFRWPPRGYDRFVLASAAARQMHPPFVGSARTDDSANGCEFPSLVASDAADGSGTSSNNRRVHFSDEGGPSRSGDGITTRCAHAPIIRKPRIMKTAKAETSFPNKSSITAAHRPMLSRGGGPSLVQSTVKPSREEKRRKLENPSDCKRTVTTSTSMSDRSNARPMAGSAMANGNETAITWTNRGERMNEIQCKKRRPNVHMNKAATMRYNHIRQQLRAEWYKACGGLSIPFPYGEL